MEQTNIPKILKMMNKKIFFAFALLFLISCNDIQNTASNTLQKAKDINVKLFDKLDNSTRQFTKSGSCEYIFSAPITKTITESVSQWYIIYDDAGTDRVAGYSVWQNLANNKFITINQDNESITISNLQSDPIQLCT